MFIDDKELIPIKVYFKKAGYSYEALTASETEAIKMEEKERGKFTELNAKMNPVNWGTHNDMQESAMVEDQNSGDRRFSVKLYKEGRLKRLLKEWDVVQKEKPVPINDQNVMRLAPAIAEAILRAYDEQTTLSEDEENF